MRWLIGFSLILGLVCGPAAAQQRPPGYTDAEQRYMQLTVDERIKLQVLLTATGYWPAVPNVSFSGRLFEAIKRYQAESGYPVTGMVDNEQFGKLLETALPLLQTWNFREIAHPTRGKLIWVPIGLGLRSERDDTGITWRTPSNRVVLAYHYFPGSSLEVSYRSTLARIAQDNGTIHYKTIRSDFFAISASSADGVDQYYRFHRDGAGVLGFFLLWNNSETHLHMERVATLVSASLWAAMTGAPFTEAPTMAPPSTDVAVTRPTPSPVAPNGSGHSPAKPKDSSSGTGFFVSSEGHVLTNAHVVNECSAIEVATGSGEAISGHLLSRDSANDLALIKTSAKPQKVAAFRMGVRLGESVAAFGYPLTNILSTSGNFTLGNVTALSGLKDDSRYFQISTPVQPGNSGGPLFDQNGNVVGVVSAKLDALKVMVATNGDIPQNVNFAIKGTLAATFLESNRLTAQQGTASQALAPADLADQARAVSVLVRCH